MELNQRNEFFKQIITELHQAEVKHPKFVKKLFDKKDLNIDLIAVQLHLVRQREEIGWNVLHEELLEVTEAYAVHNYEHALQELAQCGAVILRMMEFVQKEKKEGE